MLSFEFGPRAPTGPGIYAFRCNRANELHHLLRASSRARNEQIDMHLKLPRPEIRSIENTNVEITTEDERENFLQVCVTFAKK